MSDSQATAFAATYSVVDQYTDPISGFSGTVFDKGGVKYVAICGSDTGLFTAAQDWLLTNAADVGQNGIAINQGIALLNWLQRLVGVNGNAVVQYTYDSVTKTIGTTTGIANGHLYGQTTPMTVAGHSLGGQLAMMMSRLAPSLVSSVYTYNAPGFDTSIRTNLFPLTSEGYFNLLRNAPIGPITGQIGTSWNSTIMAHWNVQGDVVHDIGNTPGIQGIIFTESANQGVVDAHLKEPITDSLALYNLFAKIDTTASISTITSILAAATNTAANSLEAALSAVGKLYGKNYPTAETTRDVLYTNVYDLQGAIGTGGTLVSLTNKTASDITIQAQTDIAYRYALKELNPFAVTGLDYSVFNTDGSLDRYDPATGAGNLTDLYLQDRASMLSWKIYYNKDDKTPIAINYPGEQYRFKDDTSGYTVLFGNDSNIQVVADLVRQVHFGTDVADTLTGSDKVDHLYGGSGNDTISGGAANDHLEGQLDNDNLQGGTGRDTLIGGAGADILEGGADADLLQGGLGNDTYVLKSTGKANDIIIDADGLGHIEIDGIQLAALTSDDWQSPGLWQKDGITYTFTPDATGHGNLVIQSAAGITTIKNFQNGQLGITLPDAPAAQPTLPADLTLAGDLAPIIFTDHDGTPHYHYDGLGNVIVRTDIPAPGRADTLFDSTGNDSILSLGGNDTLNAFRGGNDTLDGGAGDDIIQTGAGQDTAIGNDGADIAMGQGGDDKLYAQTQISIEDALTQGATQLASNLKGDWLDGGDGRDTLTGDAGNDAFTGGSGADILLGGGGADNLMGDETLSYADLNWSITREVTLRADGVTLYKRIYNQASASVAADGGNDALYGGAGDDWLFGQLGNDYLEGGADNDVLFGEEGNDALYGGSGDDNLRLLGGAPFHAGKILILKIEQFGKRDLQDGANSQEDDNRRIADPALDLGNISAVDCGAESQFFLRNAA